MRELTKHLTNVLGEAPVASAEFEEAVDLYIANAVYVGTKGGDGEELIRRVQEIICERFVIASEEVAALLGCLGPHKVMKLFWPSLAAELFGPPPAHLVPTTIVSIISAHLATCADCLEHVALWRDSPTRRSKRKI